ncbi:uncharacterized protein LOC130672167 [Microplitis mediator]|uniref:uncharacterized protein LOC130672167 n=1 Tax=Microplitis mediator TaxID=375433 RepID=UPI002554FA75|nr:uncharacterized protein LOC130672167 [Microplitis mediator]
MDHKKHSQKRLRSSKSSEIIKESLTPDNNIDNYYTENNNLKSLKSPSELSSRYLNSTSLSGSINKNIVNDDSDNEESINEISNTKQYYRRDAFSSEETNKNNSDDDVNKRKIKQTDKILSKQEKRRKKTSQRRMHHQREEKRISTSRNDNEENIDEDRASLKQHDLSMTSKKYSKRSRTRSRSSKGEGRRRDGRGREEREDVHSNELPITEFLRQAQENSRAQYEEPVPLPELRTDTIYVQGRNRFSAVKIPTERTSRGRRGPDTDETTMYPIKIAILAQKAWKNAGFIYQGLLAGMAFMHFIFVQTYFKASKKPAEDYSIIAEIYTNLFSFFLVMCIIAAFDRFDLAHFDIEHFREIYNNYAKAIAVIPLYIAVFCLHQATMKFDDKLSLINYTANSTSLTNENVTTTISDEELNNWTAITLTKDGMVVAAWLFVSLGPQSDMLLTHLQSLEKYHSSDYY